MKKIRQNLKLVILMLVMLITMLYPIYSIENYHAATSYTNAKEFYNSTALKGEPYHAEMINGNIYYATSAKLAVSSTNLRYRTIGFDIELSGNGHSVSFTVQRTGGSMTEVHKCQDSTHEYILYVINDETLYGLARKANPTEAEQVLNASVIKVKINAIMTTIEGDTVRGGITEDGSGGFTYWGTIYRLVNSDDLKSLKNIFTGHTFESYKNILEKLDNHLLSLRYNLQGLRSTSSTTATVENGFSIMDEYLAVNDTLYIQSSRILQQMTLVNPADIKLKKTGYHLEDGQEWITADSRVFTPATIYMPKTIEPLVGTQNKGVTMYANWQPNRYTVNYDANGGTGSVLPTDFYYDREETLRENTFVRLGYKLKPEAEWNTKKDGSGKSYGAGGIVSNLTDKDGKTITLYANWEPEVYTITLDKQTGSGGTDVIYEKYGVGYFSDKKCTKAITSVTLPALKGHTCEGYYRNILGKSTHIINKKGKILTDSTYFKEDMTIYAYFTADTYTITFDKQGGRSDIGTDTATATYNEYFPKADRSIKDGYTFKGYYTEWYGKGIQHYNEYMASSGIYPYTSDITLYAHWVDETAPKVTLSVNFTSWTNQPIELTARASDQGVGLKSLIIYHIAEDGTLTAVASNSNCNGASSATLTFTNPTEGIIRYKAIATDRNNQTSESYQTVYYDITPPRGEIIKKTINGTSVFFELNVTDVHVK
ncbi:MAG: InlB B-repeat-containing protein [Agathobacter sp.]|nr:InlB B-repeat-containing protein [Agathobacter sp.]